MRRAGDEKPRGVRAAYDAHFKQNLNAQLGERLGLPIQAELAVSYLPLTIDICVILRDTADRANLLAEEPIFRYFRTHNLIEFKSQADALTESDYYRIQARACLYLADNRLSKQALTLTIVSARYPRALLSRPYYKGQWKRVKPGHYQITETFPVHLLVCNELALVRENYLLLPFTASAEQFRAFVRQLVAEENERYFRYASHVHPQTSLEILQMGKKQNFYETEMQALADTFGAEILARIPPAERMKGLTPEERADMLARLPAEARADMLARLSPQDRADMLARLPAEARADMLARLSPQDRADMLARLSPQDRADMLARLSADERVDMLARLSADERVKGLSPDERLAGLHLSPEVRSELVRQLVAADNHNDT